MAAGNRGWWRSGSAGYASCRRQRADRRGCERERVVASVAASASEWPYVAASVSEWPVSIDKEYLTNAPFGADSRPSPGVVCWIDPGTRRLVAFSTHGCSAVSNAGSDGRRISVHRDERRLTGSNREHHPGRNPNPKVRPYRIGFQARRAPAKRQTPTGVGIR